MPEKNDRRKKDGKPWRERTVRSKKSYDEERLARSVDPVGKPYKGELEPADVRRKRKNAHSSAKKDENGQSKGSRRSGYASKATPARLAALKTLREVRVRNAYAQPLIETYIDANKDLSAEDRAFATRLVLGVVSTYGSLDAIINRVIDKPTDLKPDVRDAMRVSAYEVIYLGKQAHAAVDQGVELVRSVAPSAAGLGNAVLRRILESKEDFPYGNAEENIDALALSYGFPTWLAKKLIEDMGAQDACRFMAVSNEPAPLTICVNALKTDDETVQNVFKGIGCILVPVEGPQGIIEGCYTLAEPRAVQAPQILSLIQDGQIFISDASALTIAHSVFEMPVASILEIGAGRGTKTVALQSFAKRSTGNQVPMVSVDNHAYKTRLLKERAVEYGISGLRAITADATDIGQALGEERFDTVFVDAPCSGLGTLRRHHEIRWRLTAEHIAELAEIQLAMLKSCSKHVTPGGQMIYSTCTVTYEENYGVVKAFLASDEGSHFRLQPICGASAYAPQLESHGADAHFAVRFLQIG